MPYLDMGDYEGWTGLSPPTAYPSTMGYEANEGNVQLRHHIYATTTTLALARNFCLYQESSTRAPTARIDDEPASK